MPRSEHARRPKRPSRGAQVAPRAPIANGILSASSSVVQRATKNPQSLQNSDLLYLQRTIGNSAVGNLLHKSIPQQDATNSRMEINAIGDHAEQEADRIASQIAPAHSAPPVQRSSTESLPYAKGGSLSTELEGRIHNAKGAGSAVPTSVQRKMQEATGADFSSVRVHADQEANTLSSELGAKAATHGNDIFLAKGQSPHDLQLMAHELTHTIQQGAVPSQVGWQREEGVVQRAPDARKKSVKGMTDDELRQEKKRERRRQLLKRAGYKAWKIADTLAMLPISALDHLTALPIHMIDAVEFLRTGKRWKERARKAFPGPSTKDGQRGESSEVKRAQLARKGGLTGLRFYVAGLNYHQTTFGKVKMTNKHNNGSKTHNPFKLWNRLGAKLKKGKKSDRFYKKRYGNELDRRRAQQNQPIDSSVDPSNVPNLVDPSDDQMVGNTAQVDNTTNEDLSQSGLVSNEESTTSESEQEEEMEQQAIVESVMEEESESEGN